MSSDRLGESQDHQDPSPSWAEVDEYLATELALEDAALIEARTSSVNTTAPDIEVTPHQGALMGLIAQIAGARRVLEFGTLAGYSAIWFARAVGAQGRVVSLELEQRNAEVARSNFVRAAVADRVEVLLGPAGESAQQLIRDGVEPFDLVFIDADKASTLEYLKAAVELTRPGAVILIDNVVRDGHVVDAESDDEDIQGIRTALAAIGADTSLQATVMQTVGLKGWDGLLIARRT